MKQTIFVFGFLFSVLISCTEPTKEEVLKDVFMEYVKTDFDDPSEFEEITSIEVLDTLNNKLALKTIKSMEEVSVLFSKSNIEKLAEYKSKFEADKTCIVTYKVKIRIKRNERRSVLTYYVIDDGMNYKVQDHEMQMNESPELYNDFYKFAYDLLD